MHEVLMDCPLWIRNNRSIDYPGTAADVTYVHDSGSSCTAGVGRMCQMSDASGLTAYGYDVFGNVTEEGKTIDGNLHVTSYTHDSGDHLASITYPSGRTVDYTRNILGQITAVDTSYDMSSQTVADAIAYCVGCRSRTDLNTWAQVIDLESFS